jgi:hypothetical protein
MTRMVVTWHQEIPGTPYSHRHTCSTCGLHADFPPETPWEVREEALSAHMEEHIAAYAEQFLRDAEKGEG